MRKLLTLAALAATLGTTAQTDILDARTNYSIGDVVTVTGVITSGESLGSVRYLQDETAGIALYPGTTWDDVTPVPGDEVTITGEITEFNGLLEIGPNISSTVVNSSGNMLPDQQLITPGAMDESLEAERVAIEGCTFDAAGNVFSGNSSYTFSNGTETGEIYVRSGNFLVGEAIPFGAQDLFGIVSQFSFTGDDGYQLLIEDLSGIVSASPINIITPIAQDMVTTSSFELNWSTDVDGDSFVEYGTSPDALDDELYSGDLTTDHSLSLEGLDPATVYYARVTSTNVDGSAQSNVIPFITRSNSSGEIIAYFTGPVETSVATIQEAISIGADMNDTIAAYITRATETLDIAVYNINDQTIVNAINQAHDNGVAIRYLAHGPNLNSGMEQFNDDIETFERPDDTGSGMHNKFVVIDRELADKAFVLTGSTNFTTGSFTEDLNNLIIFQEQSMARGFTLEFEEMWGTSELAADAAGAKFGDAKSFNTPVQYFSGDAPVEVYFSPTDNTTFAIEQAILSTDDEANFATLAFTRDDLRDAMIAVQEDFFTFARGVIEQTGGTGAEYETLVAAGVDVLDHASISGQMHHKYAIIDAGDASADPMVLTGSHNWSNSAENINDENTVVVHDANIANQYFQEFTAIVDAGDFVFEQSAPALEVYPNPTSDVLRINGVDGQATVQVVDAAGRVVVETVWYAGQEVDVRLLPQGAYTFTLQQAGQVWSAAFIKR